MSNFSLVRLLNSSHKKIFNLFYETMEKYIKNRTKDNEMTDHELLHINNVMENAYILVKKKYFPLRKVDLFYLCLAICIHDLAMGNIYFTRKDHHKKIYDVLKEILAMNESLHADLQDETEDIICKIAEAHSGSADEAYNKLMNENRYNSVNLLNIAMLLRISDELDITQKRHNGKTLSIILSKMKKENLLHWVKHESIVSWEILPTDESCVVLFLKPDIIDKFLPQYKTKINKNDYINFMKQSLSKLKEELGNIFTRCIRQKRLMWNLNKLEIKTHNKNIKTRNSNYIRELNQYINNNDNVNKEGNKKKSIEKFDENIRKKNEIKKKSFVPIYPKEDNKKQYCIIGDDTYRNELNEYIRNKKMLLQGCFKHRDLRILSWLDSFGFHQDNSLLHKSSNIIANDIEKRKKQDIDYIIGLGLKGAKIATIVGLKLGKPVLFYINDNIKIDILNLTRTYNFAMITDCVITGNTALFCKQKLIKKKVKHNIMGVYSVFLRSYAVDPAKNNQLMKKRIKIFTINDNYTYDMCPFIVQENCPIYRTYGEKQYERSYKQGREIFIHR